MHYTTDNIYGWPRLIARIWKLDETNKVDLSIFININIVSYGVTSLPNTTGYHEISFHTWSLQGNLLQETLSFFMDSKPMMNTSDPVSANLENRKSLITKPGPVVHMYCEVITRNFTFHSISSKNEL